MSTRSNRRIFVVVLVGVFGFSPSAYAYLDPGSAGMFLQILLGGVAGVAVVLKLYWARIKGFLFGPRQRWPIRPTKTIKRVSNSNDDRSP